MVGGLGGGFGDEVVGLVGCFASQGPVGADGVVVQPELVKDLLEFLDTVCWVGLGPFFQGLP